MKAIRTDLYGYGGRRPTPVEKRAKPLLTATEIAALECAAQGMPNAEIGQRLIYSAKSVRNIMYGINRTLGTHSRTEAVMLAMYLGLIYPPIPHDR